jgi:hypothetical protein
MGIREILLLLLSLCASTEALAATRKVFFSQRAENYAPLGGFYEANTSHLTIVITNPSTVTQNYAITMTLNSATGTAAGASGAPISGSASGAIAANGAATIVYDYPPFPASTAGTQDIIVSGYITMTEAAGAAGFVFADANITTFFGSTTAEGNYSDATRTLRSHAVYSVMPILIGEGRPF